MLNSFDISRRDVARLTVACAVASALGGCAGGALSTEMLKTGSLTISNESGTYQTGVVETYTRIARGAKACWFAPGKPLAATHMYSAAVPSPPVRAEIAVHVRSTDQPSPRAQKVFVVVIEPSGEGSAVTSINRHLDPKAAEALKADVMRWARSEVPECGKPTDALALASVPVPPLPERKPVVAVASRRRAK